MIVYNHGTKGREAPMSNFKRWIRDQEGQDTVEYGLLAAFISIAALLAIKAIGPLVNSLYVKVKDAFA
jgi:Flp pilus assembly pilin Flp